MDTSAYQASLAKVHRYQWIDSRIKVLINLQAAIKKDLSYGKDCVGRYHAYASGNEYNLSISMLEQIKVAAENEVASLEQERVTL